MNETTTYIEEYTATYRKICQKLGNDLEGARAILHEVGKERRMRALRGIEDFARPSSPDVPATEKQRALLERLGVAIAPGLTKSEASRLIDEAKGGDRQ